MQNLSATVYGYYYLDPFTREHFSKCPLLKCSMVVKCYKMFLVRKDNNSFYCPSSLAKHFLTLLHCTCMYITSLRQGITCFLNQYGDKLLFKCLFTSLLDNLVGYFAQLLLQYSNKFPPKFNEKDNQNNMTSPKTTARTLDT